jgi:hypothetical protein
MCQDRPNVDDGVVFRLCTQQKPDSLYFYKEPKPLPADFRLTDLECEEAEKNDGIGGLSVWDVSRTEPDQARAFLSTPRPTVYHLRVAAIRSITDLKLHVCRDPLADARKGADGHCLIANVYSKDEKTRRSIRASVMREAKYVNDLKPQRA